MLARMGRLVTALVQKKDPVPDTATFVPAAAVGQVVGRHVVDDVTGALLFDWLVVS